MLHLDFARAVHIFKLLTKILLLLLGYTAFPVWAIHWITIGDPQANSTSYVNIDSIRDVDTLVNYWERVDFSSPHVENDGTEYMSKKTSYFVKCGDRESAIARIVHYSASGEVTKAVDWQREEWDFGKPTQDSIGEKEIDLACKRKKMRNQ